VRMRKRGREEGGSMEENKKALMESECKAAYSVLESGF